MKPLSAPVSVDINLTKRCNLKCEFCSADPVSVTHASRNTELTTTELQDLFEQIEDMGVFLVRLAGGEPLVRRDLSEILFSLKSTSFDKILLTNGVGLSDRVCGRLHDANFNTIGISLDAPVADRHDFHRGVFGTFQKIISNLHNLRKHRLPYAAQFVVTAYNIRHLIPMVRFCEQEGFSGLKFILLNMSGKARDALRFFPSYQQWSEALVDLTQYIAAHAPRLHITILPPHEDTVPYELYFPLKEAGLLSLLSSVWNLNPEDIGGNGQIGCAAGRNQLSIFEDGSVYGCDLMRDNKVWEAGNIRTQKLQAIWDTSPIFNSLRTMHKHQLHGHCSTCAYGGCGGGCRASAWNLHQRIDASDSNCLLLN